MNSKRELYALRLDELCTETCEVLLFHPRTVYADYAPGPEEVLVRVREEVARAARGMRAVERQSRKRI